jgi:hypothetical protein
MKTPQQIREHILCLATRAAGVSRREVRDSYHDKARGTALDVLDGMLARGEVFECLRATNQPGRVMRRVFVERGAGSKWSAGLVQPQMVTPSKARPQRLERTTAVKGVLPKAEVCPSGQDQRYTVRELPKGYRSALDPRECRPWADVAAASRAAA